MTTDDDEAKRDVPVPVRFLARHELENEKLEVQCLAKRPARDWSAVQPQTSWESVNCTALAEMGLEHFKRELNRCCSLI